MGIGMQHLTEHKHPSSCEENEFEEFVQGSREVKDFMRVVNSKKKPVENNNFLDSPKLEMLQKSGRSTYHAYLAEIDRARITKRLNEDQSRELAIRAQSGDIEARDILIKSMLTFVISIANKNTGRGVSLEDLIQQGNLALTEKAVKKFDPSKGYKFSTYATHWIRCYIGKLVTKHGGDIKISISAIEKIREINKIQISTKGITGKWLSEKEVVDKLNIRMKPGEKGAMSIERFREIIKLKKIKPSSLDSSGENKDDTNQYHFIENKTAIAPEKSTQEEQTRKQVKILLDCLPAKTKKHIRNREAVEMRFGINNRGSHTLEAIGTKFGVTRSCIDLIVKKSLLKMYAIAKKKNIILSDFY